MTAEPESRSPAESAAPLVFQVIIDKVLVHRGILGMVKLKPAAVNCRVCCAKRRD